MIRRFLLIVAAVAGFLLLRRLMRGAMQGAPGGSRRGSRATQLVRDRVCNTYVPQDRALSARSRSQTGGVEWFCSQECRSRYLAGNAGGGAAALVS